jgi:integrase
MQIIRNNPTDGAVIPNMRPTFEALESDADEPLPEYLEKEQLAELIRVAKEYADAQTDSAKSFGARQMYRAIIVLANTGLRIGELCALEEPRVDTRRGTIRVISTLYHGQGIRAYQLESPKNRTSIRTVDISRTVAAVLDAQLRDLKAFRLLTGEAFYRERNFVFVSYKKFPGYPLDPRTFSRDLARLLDLAGLPKSITPHSLRHTFTSLSAEAGASLEDIQKQLGHSSDDMTRRVYLHVTEARRRANTEKLDALLGPYLRLD